MDDDELDDVEDDELDDVEDDELDDVEDDELDDVEDDELDPLDVVDDELDPEVSPWPPQADINAIISSMAKLVIIFILRDSLFDLNGILDIGNLSVLTYERSDTPSVYSNQRGLRQHY